MAAYQVMNIHFAVMKSRSIFRSSRLFRGEIKCLLWEPVFYSIVRRLGKFDVSDQCKNGIRHPLQKF